MYGPCTQLTRQFIIWVDVYFHCTTWYTLHDRLPEANPGCPTVVDLEWHFCVYKYGSWHIFSRIFCSWFLVIVAICGYWPPPPSPPPPTLVYTLDSRYTNSVVYRKLSVNRDSFTSVQSPSPPPPSPSLNKNWWCHYSHVFVNILHSFYRCKESSEKAQSHEVDSQLSLISYVFFFSFVALPGTGDPIKEKQKGKVAAADGVSDADADLQARLDDLRRE